MQDFKFSKMLLFVLIFHSIILDIEDDSDIFTVQIQDTWFLTSESESKTRQY